MTDHIKIGDIQPWAQVEQTVPGTAGFEFPFPIFEDADLEVYVDAALQQVANDRERSVRLAATAPSIALDFMPAAGDGMTMGPGVAHIAEAGTRQCLSSPEHWDKPALVDVADAWPHVGRAFDVTEECVLRNVKE